MMTERNEPNELSEAPQLRAIPKVDPFVVPEGFFERFPQQVKAEATRERMPWALFGPPLRLARLAGVLTLVAVAVLAWKNWSTPVDMRTAMTEPTLETDLLAMEELSSDQLYSLMAEDPAPFTHVDPELGADQLIAYLEEEDLPLDILVEEP